MSRNNDQSSSVIKAVVLLSFFCLLGGLYLVYINSQSKENFSDYTSCIAKGYTKEFCSQTPNTLSTDICTCSNGLLGKRLPGFGGECVCNPDLLTESTLLPPVDSNDKRILEAEPYSTFMLNYH